jgi:hypothetical protein
MVGLWPKNSANLVFYDWLKANKPQISAICSQYNLECFPTRVRGTGGNVIANKEYPQVFDRENVTNYQQQFILALDEFAGLIPIMDEAVEEYKRIAK